MTNTKKTTDFMTEVILGGATISVVNQSSMPSALKQGASGLIGVGLLSSANKKFGNFKL